jgi:hypothetical protein
MGSLVFSFLYDLGITDGFNVGVGKKHNMWPADRGHKLSPAEQHKLSALWLRDRDYRKLGCVIEITANVLNACHNKTRNTFD